jgi:mannose-6-phosphate isomerase-like protein (cupin superfamily)
MRDPIDLRPGEGEVLPMFDATLTIKTGSAGSGDRISLLEGRFQPGGFAPLPHIHRHEDESFFVLEGRFAFLVGDRRFEREAGAFVHVPPGHLHGFTNAGDTPGRILILHAPPLDRFFREMAGLAASGVMDRSALAVLMERWGMEVPPPPGQ